MQVRKILWIVAYATFVGCGCGANEPKPVDSHPIPTADSAAASTSSSGGDEVQSSEAAHELQPVVAGGEPTAWAAIYAGKIDGKIEATLSLNGLGDVVRGTITYKKSNKPITVLGKFVPDGTFFLRELQPDGNITGVLSGTESTRKLTGSWYAPGTDKELKLEFDAVSVQESGTVTWPYAAQRIAGDYGYHYGKDGPMGSLAVKQTGDKVRCKLDCLGSAPGRNMALVEELSATLVGNEVVCKVPDLDCKFRIQFFDGFAIVAFVDEHYDCEFGHNATIEGEFLKLK